MSPASKDLLAGKSTGKAHGNELSPAFPVNPLIKKVRASCPFALAGIGVLDLVLFHVSFGGIALVAFGLGWAAVSAVRKKLASVEAGPIVSPEEEMRRQLKRRLLRLQGVDGCEALAERATEHFDEASERIRSFDRLLRLKLQPTELTFTRYRSAAEQVFLSIIDRLSETAELLSSVESIHPSEVQEKLRLQPGAGTTVEGGLSPPTQITEPSPEKGALKERLSVAQAQLAKAQACLSANEQALTEMDRANASLTEMKTQSGLASVDLKEALKQLEVLAERAKSYST